MVRICAIRGVKYTRSAFASLNISSHAPRVMRTRESAAIGADPYAPQGVGPAHVADALGGRTFRQLAEGSGYAGEVVQGLQKP